MNVALMRIDFHLSGCRSLKDKRQRLRGIRDRFGRTPNVAVCESGYPDSLQRAQWSFVAASGSADVVEQTLGEIERNLQLSVDAEVVEVWREWLV
ncbi:MAG: DUF503 domain-containing protein [Gammaproteobacteria bacterium]|nr:DUF503 domain-containing protein [Gammaproteobacteria bacterium]